MQLNDLLLLSFPFFLVVLAVVIKVVGIEVIVSLVVIKLVAVTVVFIFWK